MGVRWEGGYEESCWTLFSGVLANQDSYGHRHEGVDGDPPSQATLYYGGDWATTVVIREHMAG